MMPISQLRPADIVVSTTGAGVSGAIRTGTGSSVSHAMIYVGNQFVVEAISAGVVKRTIALALADANLAIALRRRHLTDAQRTAAIQQAERFAAQGLPYDEIGAVGSGAVATGRGRALSSVACAISLIACGYGGARIARNARPQHADKAFFCSELVARVFELAGAPIVDGDPSFVTPRHVRVASSLIYVGHLKDT